MQCCAVKDIFEKKIQISFRMKGRYNLPFKKYHLRNASYGSEKARDDCETSKRTAPSSCETKAREKGAHVQTAKEKRARLRTASNTRQANDVRTRARRLSIGAMPEHDAARHTESKLFCIRPSLNQAIREWLLSAGFPLCALRDRTDETDFCLSISVTVIAEFIRKRNFQAFVFPRGLRMRG